MKQEYIGTSLPSKPKQKIIIFAGCGLIILALCMFYFYSKTQPVIIATEKIYSTPLYDTTKIKVIDTTETFYFN